jgi:PmbA protein
MDKTEALVNKAKVLGADEVIAKTTFGRRMQVRFSNNQVDISKIWNDYITDIFMAWQKRVVATQIQNFVDAEKRVEDLFKLVKVSRPNPFYGGIASGSFSYPESRADNRLRDQEEITGYVGEAIEATREEGGNDMNTGGTLYSYYGDIYLVSSEGPMGRDARSYIELSIRAFSQKEASGHGVSCSSTLDGFDPASAGRKAGEIARLARDPMLGEEGTYDIVFDPLITGSLMGTYSMMSSAFYVMIQMSIFKDKLGEPVAPEIVTIRDNPAAYSVANRAFDDEGVPAGNKVIIDRGEMKTYLHNTSTAKMFDCETTGNAGLVVPHAWSIELDSGDLSRDEMFEELGNGLYLTNTWYTRFQNYAEGDFSTIPRDGAFVVKGGEITDSLKDIRISDNMMRMLNGMKTMSRERQHIHWWEANTPTLSPYVLIEGVKITRPR